MSRDPRIDDREVLWTEFEKSFAPDTTVGQVNAILAEPGATIVCMTRGPP